MDQSVLADQNLDVWPMLAVAAVLWTIVMVVWARKTTK